jgi:hypothetical protein
MTVFPDWVASHQSPLDELVVMFEDIKVSVLEYVCRQCQVMQLLHFEVSVCPFLQYLSLGYTMPLSCSFLLVFDRVFCATVDRRY